MQEKQSSCMETKERIRMKMNEHKTAKIKYDPNLFNIDESGCLTEYIGNQAEVEVPDGVTKIGKSSFFGCKHVTRIVIPDSVINISSTAFWNCNSLTSIEVDRNNKKYKSVDGNLFSKDGTELIQYAKGKTATEFAIPNSVTTLGFGAFAYCKRLTNIFIPSTVTYIESRVFSACSGLTNVTFESDPALTNIGDRAFQMCERLTKIVIPSGVENIGSYAFYSCIKLENIEVDSKNEIYKSVDGNLYSKDQTELIQYAIGKTEKSFTVPDSVARIGMSAFRFCDSLTKAILPDSVQEIGDCAFAYCKNLENISIPNDTKIGKWIFACCHNLKH